MAASATQNAITLKGSADIVTEFFDYAINSILYQRGVYPAESFSHAHQYGLTILVTANEEVKEFLSRVLQQIKGWILDHQLKRLALVLIANDTKETLERWEFKLECEEQENKEKLNKASKDLKEIQAEIRNVIRQITASITFLPLIETSCSFDILMYTDQKFVAPENWDDTTAHMIANQEEVSLSSFTTSIHRVNSAVFYKKVD